MTSNKNTSSLQFALGYWPWFSCFCPIYSIYSIFIFSRLFSQAPGSLRTAHWVGPRASSSWCCSCFVQNPNSRPPLHASMALFAGSLPRHNSKANSQAVLNSHQTVCEYLIPSFSFTKNSSTFHVHAYRIECKMIQWLAFALSGGSKAHWDCRLSHLFSLDCDTNYTTSQP